MCRTHGRRTVVRSRQEIRNSSEGVGQLGRAQRLRARHHGPDNVRLGLGQGPATVVAPESRPKSVVPENTDIS